MSKYDDEEFNVSEYEHELRRRRKRLMVAFSIAAIVAFVGMVIFWK